MLYRDASKTKKGKNEMKSEKQMKMALIKLDEMFGSRGVMGIIHDKYCIHGYHPYDKYNIKLTQCIHRLVSSKFGYCTNRNL